MHVMTKYVSALASLVYPCHLHHHRSSMTDWNFVFEKAPSTPEEWVAEFAKYQRSPEYKKMNQDMTVDEYKFIYHMEWGHRMLGE